MTYHQITLAERYHLGQLRAVGARPAAIARVLGGTASTIGREVRRNRTRRWDLSAVSRRLVRARPAQPLAAQSAAYAARTGPGDRPVLRRQDGVPSRSRGGGRRRAAADQPRDHLSLHLGRRRAGGALYRFCAGARKRPPALRAGTTAAAGSRRGARSPTRPGDRGARGSSAIGRSTPSRGQRAGHCLVSLVERKTGLPRCSGKLRRPHRRRLHRARAGGCSGGSRIRCGRSRRTTAAR